MVALSPNAFLDDEREELGALFGPSKQKKLEKEKERLEKEIKNTQMVQIQNRKALRKAEGDVRSTLLLLVGQSSTQIEDLKAELEKVELRLEEF